MNNDKQVIEKQKEMINIYDTLVRLLKETIELAQKGIHHNSPAFDKIAENIIKVTPRFKQLESELAALERSQEEPIWDNDKVIDFVNWYLRLCKIITNNDCRLELENQTVIDSFLDGDDYELWWRDDIADKRIHEIEAD